jgi:hypothetical protein
MRFTVRKSISTVFFVNSRVERLGTENQGGLNFRAERRKQWRNAENRNNALSFRAREENPEPSVSGPHQRADYVGNRTPAFNPGVVPLFTPRMTPISFRGADAQKFHWILPA